jgi:hypothetical protein
MGNGKFFRILAFPISLLPFPILIAGCAASVPALPSGDGTPFPGFASAYTQAIETCQSIKTLTALMSLSGRVGTQKLRGRVDAGLEAPDRLVLEATAPWGKPYFVLGAASGEATLVLPREGRVLRGARPEAIVEALTGVSLTPAELRGILGGCGLASGPAASGRTFDGGWAAIEAGGTTMWLRQIDGRWRVAASVRGPMFVHYSDYTAAHPGTVRVRMTSPGKDTADLTLRLSDVERNAALDPGVFAIDVPGDAVPVTLEELRRAGPLGRQSP